MLLLSEQKFCPFFSSKLGSKYGAIQSGMTTINVWERIGEKHLAQLVGEWAYQPDNFPKYMLGCALSYGTCPISLCAL